MVTIVMPVYNGEKTIRQAVESVLTQTYDQWELLIYDDGSADGTVDYLKTLTDPRIRIHYSHENRGYVYWLNEGLRRARGEFIARLDADDVCLPQRLERQLARFQNDENLVLVGSNTLWIDLSGGVIGEKCYPERDEAIRWELLFDNPFCHPSVMMRRSILRRESILYNESLLPSEDYEMWVRLLGFGKGENIQEPLLKYRLHPGQISCTRRAGQLEHHDEIVAGALKSWGMEPMPANLRRGLRMIWQGESLRGAAADVSLDSLLGAIRRLYQLFIEQFGRERVENQIGRKIFLQWKRLFWKECSWRRRVAILMKWQASFGGWTAIFEGKAR